MEVAIVLSVAVSIFDAVVWALLVGFAARSFLTTRASAFFRHYGWLIFFVFIGFMDVYWLPVLSLFDVSFTVGDPALAEFLDISAHGTDAVSFIAPEVTDGLFWMLQGTLAHWVMICGQTQPAD